MKKLTLNGVEAATGLSHLQMKAIKGGATFNCYCHNGPNPPYGGSTWVETSGDLITAITQRCYQGTGTCTQT